MMSSTHINVTVSKSKLLSNQHNNLIATSLFFQTTCARNRNMPSTDSVSSPSFPFTHILISDMDEHKKKPITWYYVQSRFLGQP